MLLCMVRPIKNCSRRINTCILSDVLQRLPTIQLVTIYHFPLSFFGLLVYHFTSGILKFEGIFAQSLN